MSRQNSREAPYSPSGSNDGPALPSHASWAHKATHIQQDKSSSGVPSVTDASPAISHAAIAPEGETLANAEDESSSHVGQDDLSPLSELEEQVQPTHEISEREDSQVTSIVNNLIRTLATADLSFHFSTADIPDEDLPIIENFPPLFDSKGGERRRLLREQQEEQRQRRELEAQIALQAVAATEPEENPESGSLQLGGEPEDQQDINLNQRHQNAIQPPSQANLENNFLSGGLAGLNLNNRNAPTQHQDYQLLQTLKPNNPQANLLLNSFHSSQSHPNSSAFPSLSQHPGGAPGHARQSSKFNFGGDNTTSKPAPHGKAMNQQPSLVSPAGGSHLNQHQGLGNQFFSTVQGPPPGLKTTGTPPVSGGGMFGQGHGFANNALGFSAGLTGRNSNDEYLNDLMRGGRGRTNTGGPIEAGKRESHFPSFLNQHPQSSTPTSVPGLLSFHYGPQSGPLHDSGSQKPKKKGKKHRHANTSSSGGGGVVDVADPSILQARLHQGGATGGQGLYGGQGQGGFNSMMYGGGGFGRY